MAATERRTAGLLIALAILASSSVLFLSAQAPQPVGTWSPSGAIADGRIGAAGVALRDGTTLIVGGALTGTATDTVLRYDPATGALVTAGQLVSARTGHTATLLEDGRVLIAGGRAGAAPATDIEVFDPDTGTATVLGQFSQPRIGHAAARINDSIVVVFGGAAADGVVLDTVERIDVASGTVSAGANRMLQARVNASATTLIDGRVLIAGGNDGTADLRSAEIYFQWSQGFEPAANELSVPRSGHAAVLLPHNGGVLIAGGSSNGAAQASADLFVPAESPDPYSFGVSTFAATGAMASARAGALAGPGREGYAWIEGGGSADAESYRFATIKTDKDDYAPGERAVISGSGWMPGEDVRLLFQEDPAVHPDYELMVTADAAGNIYWDQWAPEQHDLGVRFYLLASDSRSRAQITFTDGNIPVDGITIGAQTPASIAPGDSATYDVTVRILGNSDVCTAVLDVIPSGSSPLPAGTTFEFRLIPSGTLSNTVSGAGGTTHTRRLTLDTPGGTAPNTTYGFTVRALQGSDCQNQVTRTALGNLIVGAAPNTAPVAASQSVTTNEDTALTITLSSSDADGNTQSFGIVTNPANGTLGSIGAVSCAGTSPRVCTADVTYTPAADYNGADSFTFRSNDGTVNSATATVSITVQPVNDAPSFTKGADVTVNEDSAAHTAASWATGISAGPANESGQTVSFVVSNDNSTLFSVQPAVSPSGTLTFTPAADAFGTATVTIHAQDDGGTANSGDDTSDAQTFTISVNAVNDAPTFTKGPDVTVNEDSGAYSQAWATAISAGPANESGQAISFVASNNNSALFSVQPAVSPSGVLSFTPAADAFGTATVTIHARDDGGTANGGDDTSDAQTFVITVSAINDAPSFTKGADVTVAEDSGAYSQAWATAISAGPANESGQAVSFVVTNNNNALFSVQPGVSPSGVLSFTPAANAFGTATVTIYAQDDGGMANGGDDTSDTQTFIITVSAVNDAPAITGLTLSAAAINENDSVTLSGTFTDPDVGDSHVVQVAWGDGAPITAQNLGAGVFLFAVSHTYLDDNPTSTPSDLNNIVVTITDDASTTGGVGLSGSSATSIQVSNVIPVITTLSDPSDPIQLGGSAAITATFTDVGTLDTHTCTFDWDDGTTSSLPGVSGTCTGTKAYSDAGVYTVRVTVADDDTGEASTYYKYVVVYDPSAGFVTGGGWLMSPVIPGIEYMTEAGRANFGFVSKYQKGAKVPTGQTEFQFKAGNLNFNSSSYDWLVVAGARAQYKGVGRINGALAPNGTPYKFLLTATDGQANGGDGLDKFRIKIWWEDGATVTIVYDNAPGSDDIDQALMQVISGGSIVIHSNSR